LSITYRTRGDETTWSEVARRTTGNDMDASEIQRSNPSAQAPFSAGVVLQIPMVSTPISKEPTDGPVDIRLEDKITGLSPVLIGTYNQFEVTQAVDAPAKGRFRMPNTADTRALVRPLTAPGITIDFGGVRQVTGRAVSPQMTNTGDTKELMVDYFSLPGVLENAYPPFDSFPREWKDTDLKTIADDLCAPHGVVVDFDESPGARFERLDIGPEDQVLPFLYDLAKQRGFVVTDTPAGHLRFWKGESGGAPVAHLERGVPPVFGDPDVQYNEDAYFASVTGRVPSKSKRNKKGASFTVQNPFKTDLVRPYNFEARDISVGELETVVKSTAGRMFAGVVTVGLDVSTWLDKNGDPWRPGTTITFKSEEDFIEKPFKFLISMVTFHRDSKSKSASLTMVIPGVFSGVIPEQMPWQ